MRNPLQMNAVEFEIWIKQFLQEQGGHLRDFRTVHLEQLTGVDGDYVMDVTAHFEALGVNFTVLVECKRYTSDPVEREQVQALEQKRLSTGAHKAIVFTTSTFRSGAVDFARTHGIGLIEVRAKQTNVILKSWKPNLDGQVILPSGTSIREFIFGRPVPKHVPQKYYTREAESIAWRLDILKEQLDYARVLESRGILAGNLTPHKINADIAETEQRLWEQLRADDEKGV